MTATATAANQAYAAANLQQIRRDERLLIRSKAALKDELVYARGELLYWTSINEILQNKSSHTDKIKAFIAVAGDRPNERVIFCNRCKANGFAHEAIDFRKVSSGRIKNDGSYEFERYEVLNYFSGGKHEHKHRLLPSRGVSESTN